MIFLGVLLDGVNHCLCIPQEKKERAERLLNWVISKRKVMVRFTQQLAGVLNFLAKAIIPGRTFICSMYRKIHTRNSKGEELKQYHHIMVDKEFVNDSRVWKEFLDQETLNKTLICRPFSDLSNQTKGVILNFYSDASMARMGVLFGHRWIAVVWDPVFLAQESPGIDFLELYALVVAVLLWGHLPQLQNSKVTIFCDNQIVQSNVNLMTAGSRQSLKLLRLLALDNLHFNRKVKVIYVKSKLNVLADAISRLDFKRFKQSVAWNMDKHPTPIREDLWPLLKIWFDS